MHRIRHLPDWVRDEIHTNARFRDSLNCLSEIVRRVTKVVEKTWRGKSNLSILTIQGKSDLTVGSVEKE